MSTTPASTPSTPATAPTAAATAAPATPAPSPAVAAAPKAPAKAATKAAPAAKAVKPAAPKAKKPAAKPAAAAKAPAAPAAPKTPKAPKAAKPAKVEVKAEPKPKKAKLVRDSFTIPKAEYLVLDTLKERALKLSREVKKSELLRAGIKALAALSDTALLAALSAVPTIKTGRPVADKPAAQDKPAKKVRSTKR